MSTSGPAIITGAPCIGSPLPQVPKWFQSTVFPQAAIDLKSCNDVISNTGLLTRLEVISPFSMRYASNPT